MKYTPLPPFAAIAPRPDTHLSLIECNTKQALKDRIVVTARKGLPGVGYTRPEWSAIKDMRSGTVTRTILHTALPSGPVKRPAKYTAPFAPSSREQDYQKVWTKLNNHGGFLTNMEMAHYGK